MAVTSIKVRKQKFTITRELLRSPRWARFAGVAHGFSTRHIERDPFFRKHARGLKPVLVHQVHSDRVSVVNEDVPAGQLHCDAQITATPGLALAVKTADCIPVLLYDPQTPAVGAVHAGWRGTASRIAEKTVGAMRAQFGSDPARMHAIIGPGIGACCYEVGDEVVEVFRTQFPYADELLRNEESENPADILLPRQVMFEHQGMMRPLTTGRAHLDLPGANRRQLLDAGLREENIVTGALCTSCRTDILYSFRREKEKAGRIYAFVGIRTK